MAVEVIKDRFTTEMTDPFVVFLIGARVSHWSHLRRFQWVGQAFTGMMQELNANPEKGYLAGESFFRLFPLTTILVSYWRSFDDLERFARDRNDLHMPAWKDFYRRVGLDGTIGIWHETYKIEPGQYEVVYANMPLFGLAKATQNPISFKGGHRLKARGRMKGEDVQLEPELELE